MSAKFQLIDKAQVSRPAALNFDDLERKGGYLNLTGTNNFVPHNVYVL